jgi:hypothetical protein
MSKAAIASPDGSPLQNDALPGTKPLEITSNGLLTCFHIPRTPAGYRGYNDKRRNTLGHFPEVRFNELNLSYVKSMPGEMAGSGTKYATGTPGSYRGFQRGIQLPDYRGNSPISWLKRRVEV